MTVRVTDENLEVVFERRGVPGMRPATGLGDVDKF